MNLAQYSFLVFVFLKQFYIFKSGTLQPGDFFLLLSCVFVWLNKKSNLFIKKIDYYFIAFLSFAVVVNLVYYIIYGHKSFLMSTLFLIFNFMVIILFRNFIENKKFNLTLLKVLKGNLIVQLFVSLIGQGRVFAEVRYMGTFNDPNQFSFFIYMTLMLVVIISKLYDKKISIIYYILTIYFIFKSSSTGMLLAIVSFLCLYIFFNMINKRFYKRKSVKVNIFKMIFILGTILFIVYSLAQYREEIVDSFSNLTIIQRLEDKLSRVDTRNNNESKVGIIEERSIDKLLLYPEQMILGSGEGYYARFNKAYNLGEIHSTLPSILFYYGILPTVMLLIWFYKNIKNIPLSLYAIFVSLFIESFTLLNQRQPMFWMLFVFSSLYALNKNNIVNFEERR